MHRLWRRRGQRELGVRRGPGKRGRQQIRPLGVPERLNHAERVSEGNGRRGWERAFLEDVLWLRLPGEPGGRGGGVRSGQAETQAGAFGNTEELLCFKKKMEIKKKNTVT